jgi:tRNA dimethylallyltransferase
MYYEAMQKPLIYVICGPTATGKSDYAVELALRKNGEVISADSRQIYRGMDLGTGKITHEEMKSVPHHLLDIRDPNEDFSVEEFQKLCFEKIEEILARNKVPIICGGTGFFIQSVVDNIVFPVAPANPELRAELETKSLEELQGILKSIPMEDDAKVDTENKRRVIRAIELGRALGQIPAQKYGEQKYNFEMIGLDKLDAELQDRISKRLSSRLEAGMVAEVKRLHDEGVSWERLENFGLEYKYIAEFLQNKITEPEMIETLKLKIWQYAKRQRTWFRRDPRIKWI